MRISSSILLSSILCSKKNDNANLSVDPWRLSEPCRSLDCTRPRHPYATYRFRTWPKQRSPCSTPPLYVSLLITQFYVTSALFFYCTIHIYLHIHARACPHTYTRTYIDQPINMQICTSNVISTLYVLLSLVLSFHCINRTSDWEFHLYIEERWQIDRIFWGLFCSLTVKHKKDRSCRGGVKNRVFGLRRDS